jgi:hypothetical protein
VLALLGCNASPADGAPSSLGEIVLAAAGAKVGDRFLSPRIIETFIYDATAPEGAKYFVATADAEMVSQVFGNFIVDPERSGYREFSGIEGFSFLLFRGSLNPVAAKDDFLRDVGAVVRRAERATTLDSGNSAIVVAGDDESFGLALDDLSTLASLYAVRPEEFSATCSYAKFSGGDLPGAASVMVIRSQNRTVDLADPETRDCFVEFFARNTGLAVDAGLASKMAGFEQERAVSAPCEFVRVVDYPSPNATARLSTEGCPTAPDLHATIYSYFLVSSERLSRQDSGPGPVTLDEFEAACRANLADADKAEEVCDF